jgi:hypothetical protein
MASDSDESDLSFHINSTYCSTSDSEGDLFQNSLPVDSVSTRKSQIHKNPVPGVSRNRRESNTKTSYAPSTDTLQSQSRPDIPANIFAFPSMSRTNHRDELLDEPSMHATSLHIPSHIPPHSIISPLIHSAPLSPNTARRSFLPKKENSKPFLASMREAGNSNCETESFVFQVQDLREQVTGLQADNRRLSQQV